MSSDPTPQQSPRSRRRAAAAQHRANGHPGSRPVAITARPSVWRSPMVIVTVVAALVMVAIIAILVLTSGQTNGTPSGSLGLVRPPESNLATFADGETLGAADAPVVLEVFSDYQCPVCGKFGRDYVPRLVNEFVEPGTLRIVERSIAILDPEGGRESLDAAAGAACAARQDAHWQYHDYLMWNQIGENRGAFSRERLFGMAERVGLDRDAFAACLDDGAVRSEIADRTAAALADGINSTPTFLVNGERFVGLLSYDDLSVAIEKHLAEASAGS